MCVQLYATAYSIRPMPSKTSEPQTKKFTFSISRNLVLGFLLFVLMIIGVSFSMYWFAVRSEVEDLSRDTHNKLAQNITLALERELQEAKGMASAMASTVMAMPADERDNLIQKIIPALLTPTGKKTLYVGGGIWPEPYVFDTTAGRQSYFWTQDRHDKLIYRDDYNKSETPGYQREPWYVPAQIFNNNTVYWSAAFSDAYSKYAIVKCVAPMYQGAKFQGVATVDVKLDSVEKLAHQLIAGLDAYAFVVDRNGRFIVFPTLGYDMSRRSVKNLHGGFEYLEKLADDYPHFRKIVAKLATIDQQLFADFSKDKPERLPLIARLQEASYALSEKQAQHLLTNLWLSEKQGQSIGEALSVFGINDDLLLKSDATAFVYHMPSTQWRVVTVFQNQSFMDATDVITRKVLASILFAVSVLGFIAYLLLQNYLVKPLRNFASFVALSMSGREKKPLRRLAFTKNDEFGLLAYWFNRNNMQLDKALAKASRATKAKSDFLAGVAHELRTPIHSIIGFNRKLIVKMGSDLDDQNYRHLIAVQRSSHHLLNLIEDIFDVSQIESGKIKLKFELESSNALLDDAVSQMTGQVADAKLDFEVLPLDEDIYILADRNKVIQVLIHLIANALQATEKGKITISAEATYLAETEAVAFCVEDTGRGLSDDEKHLIFKQFTRVEEYAGIEHGIGLGLYLVREIVALHSGALYFDSTLGQGTRFTVVFLLKPPQVQSDIDLGHDDDDYDIDEEPQHP